MPRRPLRITAETPYGECSERLTAIGGLLALVKFLDVIGFERAFAEDYVHPRREQKLGGYRMVLGILLLLFIGFQRLGHCAYVSTRRSPPVAYRAGFPCEPAPVRDPPSSLSLSSWAIESHPTNSP